MARCKDECGHERKGFEESWKRMLPATILIRLCVLQAKAVDLCQWAVDEKYL
jgi:hypothetical protein